MAEQTEGPAEEPAPPKSPWKIIVEPIGDNGGTEKKKNVGGMSVVLTHTKSGSRHEVTRVAFERKNSSHPDTAFEEQLRDSIGVARASLTVLRESLTWDGELQ